MFLNFWNFVSISICKFVIIFQQKCFLFCRSFKLKIVIIIVVVVVLNCLKLLLLLWMWSCCWCFLPSCWMDGWVAELEQLNKTDTELSVAKPFYTKKTSPAKDDDALLTQLLRQKVFHVTWWRGGFNLLSKFRFILFFLL